MTVDHSHVRDNAPDNYAPSGSVPGCTDRLCAQLVVRTHLPQVRLATEKLQVRKVKGSPLEEGKLDDRVRERFGLLD